MESDTRSYHEVIEANKDFLSIFGWIYWVLLGGSTFLWAIIITWACITYDSRRERARRAKEMQEYTLEEIGDAQLQGSDSDSEFEEYAEDVVQSEDIFDPFYECEEVEAEPEDLSRRSLLSAAGRDRAGRHGNGYGTV